jgi:CPA1 family monovalent cation:H+ antiporter
LIIVTLVLQGLTLPTLIRRLGLAGTKTSFREEQEARRAIAEAALQRLSELRVLDLPDFNELYEDMAQHYQRRLESFNQPEAPEGESKVTKHRRYVDVSRELLGVERDTALKLRRQGLISEEIARELERELDLNETRLNTAARRGPGKS